MRLSFLLSALLLSLFASVASAADFYVSPGGNDANAGTSAAAPWKTVGKVNGRNLAAGDRVFFQGGQVFSDAGLKLTSNDTGTAASPVVIGSYGTGRATLQPPAAEHAIDIYNTAGLHLRDLILVGPGAAQSDINGKRGLQAYCDLASGAKLAYLRLENLDISAFHEGLTIGAWHASFSGFQDVLITSCIVHDNLGNGISTYGYQPGTASLQSHANLQIVGCEVMRNYGDPTLSNPAAQHSGSGIILSGAKGGLVDRCYVHHNGGGAGDNAGGGPVGIWTYSSDSVTMQRNLVHDQKTTTGAVDGGGFDIDGGATNAMVQYNYSYNNEGPGFLVAEYTGATPLQNGIFRYNVSWRDGRRQGMASGFHFWSGEDLATECQDIRVYNNLVYSENATGGPCVTYQSGPMAGLRLWNNIFVVQGGESFVDIGSNTGSFTIQGNLYWTTDAVWTGGWKWGATTYTSLTAWRAATGSPETLAGNPVGVQADPLVANLVVGAQPTSVAAMEAMTAFKLLAGSPAIGAGLDLRTAAFGSLDVGVRDFWNGVIPQGGSFDIGPHEAALSATYSVDYNANGATSGTVPAAQTKTQGVALTLATNSGTLARTAYTFVGWNTLANGTGTDYAVGGSYSTDAALTLYATWTALPTYAVSYNANGATSGTAPASQTKMQDVALTLATNSGSLTRSGYTFAGWNTAADGSGSSYAVGASYTANAALTLFTKWTASTYAITYNVNGATSGTAPATQTKTQGVALTLATNSGSLTRSGYTFAGWNTAADGTGSSFAVGGSYTANAAATLFAVWTVVGPLPTGWTSQVIGSVSPTGAANGDGGSFTISGSGSDIWGAVDAFRYAWQPISGDFDAVVRVDSQVMTNAWAKAGLMVRESTAVGSQHVSVFVTPGNGTVMQHRAIAGGSSSSIAGPLTPAPTWLKLSRRGTGFTSYQSSDGVTWKLIATRTVALPGSALLGLAVTSHANGVLSTAVFSGFTLAPVAPN